jgi:hypothetical protein
MRARIAPQRCGLVCVRQERQGMLDWLRTIVGDQTIIWTGRYGAPRRIRDATGAETLLIRGRLPFSGAGNGGALQQRAGRHGERGGIGGFGGVRRVEQRAAHPQPAGDQHLVRQGHAGAGYRRVQPHRQCADAAGAAAHPLRRERARVADLLLRAGDHPRRGAGGLDSAPDRGGTAGRDHELRSGGTAALRYAGGGDPAGQLRGDPVHGIRVRPGGPESQGNGRDADPTVGV